MILNGLLLACCPQPIPCNCQQPTPCQNFAPSPQPQCPCAAVAKARDEKTVIAQPLDELELRAQVSGVRLDQQPTLDSQIVIPRQLELLERLGEDQQYRGGQRLGPPQAHSYFSSPNIRFSPQLETTTSSTVESSTKIIDESTTSEPILEASEHVNEEDQDIKCNSQVLKKIMLDVS